MAAVPDKAVTPATPLAPGVALDDFLPYLLNRISNRLNSDLIEDLKAVGATLADWRVLAVLHVHDGRSIGELSVYTVIEQSTLSRIIDRMEQTGLVERRAATTDGRSVRVFLARAGRSMFDRILPMALHHYHRAVGALSPEEQRQLVGLLHRVLETVRATSYP